MRILPILFNTEMVRAILDGRKTVTRRICKDANELTVPDMSFYAADKRTYAVHNYANKGHTDKLSTAERTCPICSGDILYVRETWRICNFDYDDKIAYIVYKASENEEDEGCRAVEFTDDKFENLDDSMAENSPDWRPSIHMPKEAARIWLKVNDVRVERLQEMNEVDTAKEGIRTDVKTHRLDDPDFIENFGGIELFKNLWNSTIKKSDLDRYGWDANPWVWVIEFELCDKPGKEVHNGNS